MPGKVDAIPADLRMARAELAGEILRHRTRVIALLGEYDSVSRRDRTFTNSALRLVQSASETLLALNNASD